LSAEASGVGVVTGRVGVGVFTVNPAHWPGVGVGVGAPLDMGSGVFSAAACAPDLAGPWQAERKSNNEIHVKSAPAPICLLE